MTLGVQDADQAIRLSGTAQAPVSVLGASPGLLVLIDGTPGIEVAGEAATGAQAVQVIRETQPDVVIMDIRMPGMDGIEATQLITAADTPPRGGHPHHLRR